MKRIKMWLVAILALWGASVSLWAASDASGFENQPPEAAPALKATLGRPFSSGYVFVNGKYIKPPYKVERYGTIIRINGIQVTNPVVAWDEFLKTQAGVTVKKIEAPVEAPREEAEAEEEEEEEEEEEIIEEESSSDLPQTLDDLFNDDPVEKKKVVRKPKRRVVARPKKPEAKVIYSLEGDFVPNERSKALVVKINAVRTRIDTLLRRGGYFCFGARYSSVSGDASTANRLIAKLPNVMKKNSDREAFGVALRQAGLTFFPMSLVDDLFRNRIDYFQLLERAKEEQEKNKWQSILNPVM